VYTECILYYAKSINKINYFLAIIQAFNHFLVGLFWECNQGIGEHRRGFGYTGGDNYFVGGVF